MFHRWAGELGRDPRGGRRHQGHGATRGGAVSAQQGTETAAQRAGRRQKTQQKRTNARAAGRAASASSGGTAQGSGQGQGGAAHSGRPASVS